MLTWQGHIFLKAFFQFLLGSCSWNPRHLLYHYPSFFSGKCLPQNSMPGKNMYGWQFFATPFLWWWKRDPFQRLLVISNYIGDKRWSLIWITWSQGTIMGVPHKYPQLYRAYIGISPYVGIGRGTSLPIYPHDFQLKPQDRGDPGAMDPFRTDLSELTDLVPGGGVLKGRRLFFFAKKIHTPGFCPSRHPKK